VISRDQSMHSAASLDQLEALYELDEDKLAA
jgi:hypothetical protein